MAGFYFIGSIIFVGVFTQFQIKKAQNHTFLYTRIIQKQVRKGDLCYMNINMDIPGLKGVIIEKYEQVDLKKLRKRSVPLLQQSFVALKR